MRSVALPSSIKPRRMSAKSLRDSLIGRSLQGLSFFSARYNLISSAVCNWQRPQRNLEVSEHSACNVGEKNTDEFWGKYATPDDQHRHVHALSTQQPIHRDPGNNRYYRLSATPNSRQFSVSQRSHIGINAYGDKSASRCNRRSPIIHPSILSFHRHAACKYWKRLTASVNH